MGSANAHEYQLRILRSHIEGWKMSLPWFETGIRKIWEHGKDVTDDHVRNLRRLIKENEALIGMLEEPKGDRPLPASNGRPSALESARSGTFDPHRQSARTAG